MKPYQGDFDEVERRHANRLKPPRPPRLRAAKSNLQRSLGRSDLSVKPDRAFDDEQLASFASGLRLCSDARELLSAGLQDIGTTCLRQRAQPETAKPKARYDLALLAYATAEYLRNPEGAYQPDVLRQMIGRLSDRARSYLWGGVVRHVSHDGSNPEAYLTGDTIDWRFVGQAAEIGCSLMTGGCYGDLTAAITLNDMITLYESVTQTKATFSRREIGPMSVDGTHRAIGNSPFYRFAKRVFAELDEAVRPAWICSKLPELLYDGEQPT